MSAQILDDEVLDQDEQNSIPPDTEALSPQEVIENLEGQTQETLDPIGDEDLPEKYRGKSASEIAQMHIEAEKLIGKQSGEVGELRQFVDGYIKGQTSDKTALEAQEEAPEEVDFFEDPEKAISRAIDQHPSVREAALQAQQYKTQTALSALKQKHPDMTEVLQDPNFSQWVQGSNIRTELYQRADQSYDVDAADELISNYKERTQVVQRTQEVDQQARSAQIKVASTGGVGGASPQGTGGRNYRRVDLIKLMQSDPDRYDALQPEILKAYAEGRVK